MQLIFVLISALKRDQIKKGLNKLISRLVSARRQKQIKKGWYAFSRNPTSAVGLALLTAIIFVAIFADYVSPYPEHAGLFIDFPNAFQPPSWQHLAGTDEFGRDILSRIFFGCRFSLLMAVVVLAIVVPIGVILGLVAGYYATTWKDTLIMRFTDVLLGVPPLITVLAISAVLQPSLLTSMMVVSAISWTWYTRVVYGIVSSLRNEFFVQAAEVTGASRFHILFREILPNCLGAILTKATLDAGWVILIAASLSFVGLGAQPPTPDLGTMVSTGAKYLPESWWMSLMPAFTILLILMGFNLLGDGVQDLFAAEGA